MVPIAGKFKKKRKNEKHKYKKNIRKLDHDKYLLPHY